MAKKNSLGRGLGEIFDDVEDAYNREFEIDTSIVSEIEISQILPNPYQPRKNFNQESLRELSQSIQRHGLIQPVIVVARGDGYMLIAGERRLRATKMLGYTKISAIVADLGSKNLRELALIENIQRENLNPIELANSYKELIDEYKITQEELANILHKSRTQITNTMRLLSLSDETKALLADEKLTQSHAKVIVGLDRNDEKLVVDTIIGQKLNVRDTENLIQKIKNQSKKSEKILKDVWQYQNELEKLSKKFENFSVKTTLKDRKIVLEFDSLEQIRAFLDKF
ncbi:ParB/RepB/Spo0J family partition protein [Campylobacter gastrosuis]|uniref:ParB/RepB/Spo0J family partition protein n=1 Tax=Campylobacter gastrosuis TaxID=2974576 RepID=A0ABT7HQL5_9BACT|nr:ParB/RepB/Spo0J family partition protein [Campylobacter gastrosuis]MDL0088908.1 ParB/RepB/Spo0J family partition protein [Campylobacter gastrosuis]